MNIIFTKFFPGFTLLLTLFSLLKYLILAYVDGFSSNSNEFTVEHLSSCFYSGLSLLQRSLLVYFSSSHTSTLPHFVWFGYCFIKFEDSNWHYPKTVSYYQTIYIISDMILICFAVYLLSNYLDSLLASIITD